MKVNQKKKNNNFNFPNDINIISPLSALESRKVLYFQKINSLNDINTFGSQPVIVYKKTSKRNNNNNQKSPNHFLNSNKNTAKYISDGNIYKKLKKFNSSSNIQYHDNKNIKIKKRKSFTENIVLIEKDRKIKEEKEKIKNIKEQKLFSQTVRQSNMRPIFPKNKNKQFNLTKNGFNKNNKTNEIEKTNDINKEKNNEKENIKEIEIKKNIIMNQLVENAVAIEIKKYQNKNNKLSIETIKNNKKREYLEENGITTSTEEITEIEKENKNNELNNENNQEKEKKKLQNIIIPKHNNFISPEDITRQNINIVNNKIKNKPSIEQFEFLLKIKEEQKKLISTQKKDTSFNKYLNSNYNSNRVNPSIYEFSNQLENSFRKKNMKIFEEKIKITNDKNENSLEDKRNHRSTKEINEYLREKKIKYKQNEETKQLEKNKKLFLRFKNLYNLNMKDIDIGKTHKHQPINHNHKQKKLRINNIQNNQLEERKDDCNSYPINNKIYNLNTYLNNNVGNQSNNIRKKKEINEYYIGNDSTIRNNNSTVVDANEYYLNILESQQLLVNSRLKKINNETEINQNINIQENNERNNEEETDYNDININMDINNKNNLIINELNELSVSKEQIKKITDKEKAKVSNSKKSEEILNTNSIEELKQKINTTLKRANLFFSKEVIENYKLNILNNLPEYSELNNNITGYNQISTNNNNKEDKKEEISQKVSEIEANDEKNEQIDSKLVDNHLNEEDKKQKSSEIKIETSNINNSNNIQSNNDNIVDINLENSEDNTSKEKNLTSLSHTYNNSTNPNKKLKIVIEPRAVLNLVEILKFIIQRKIFVMLYESYINHAIFQQYNIAFSFFVAICKQYPFKKLEEFYNYKTYNYAFRQLFRPFNRKNFKYFLSLFHFKKKVEYLVALLSKMIKFKTLEKIYIYGQYIQEDDEEKAFKMIILKIIYTLTRPHLYEAFNIFKNNIYQNIDNKNEEKDDSEVNFNISDEDENISIDNNFINLNNEKKTENNLNENLNSKINLKYINSKEPFIEGQNLNNIDDINEKNIKNNDENNISNNSIKNHRRKNDSSIKMNSFLYESLESEEKSSISVEPNSLDNDKLHQLKMVLIAKNKNFEKDIDDNYMNDDNDIDLELNNSLKKSEKSLQELMNIKSGKNASKTLSDMMEENSFQKSASLNSIDDLKKTLSNKIFNDKEKKNDIEKNKSNSNENSINSKEFKEKNEEIKMINETKDTKEITDDSNAINMNTNNKSDTKSSEIKTNEKNLDININNNETNIVQNINKIIIDENNDSKNEEKKEDELNVENKKNDIELEYNMPKNNLKSRLLKNYKIIENNTEQNEECKNNENEKIKLLENKKIKIPLIKIINDSNDSDNKNSKEDSKSKESQPKNKINDIFENKEQFTEDLINEIMNKIIFSEIKNPKIKLIPNKKYKFDKFLKKVINNNNSSQSQNNSLTNSCNSAGNFRDSHKNGSHSLNKLSLHEEVFSLNDSLNSNYSVYSVFNKTIKDKKKEHSLHLYFNSICPKLISYLHTEIIKKYPRIYENISLQKKNISENLMISLVLQDAQMLRTNYKKIFYKERLDKIIDKREILKNFSAINKKIRQEDNITSDNYYDNMINECVLETAIELIERERFYGDNGEPLKWSSRTREISFKYGKNDAKKFADHICKNILKIIHNRIGLINDNYSYMNQDELNYEREKRLLDTIKNDLNRNESQWKNLEMEETQLKVESTEMILDQLYNEVIEILEHIQFNRESPELYQYKSIYACEEIPKLSFQQTTTEDMRIPEGEENDFMNI